MSNKLQEKPLPKDVASLINGFPALKAEPDNKPTKLIGELEVKPQERSRISLGSFTAANPPKGFSVELTPDPYPAGSIVTKVRSTGTPGQYELILQAANYGSKPVSAKVRQLL